VLLDDFDFVQATDCSQLGQNPGRPGDLRVVLSDAARASEVLAWQQGSLITGGEALG